MKVSAVVPTFNEEKSPLLVPTLESIANQTHDDIELVIVDDASTDDTMKILEKFAFEHQNIDIKLISNKTNMGCHASIALGVRNSTGDLIIPFLGSDDISHPTRFEKQARFLADHLEIDIVGSWFMFIDEKRQPMAYMKVPEKHGKIRWEIYKLGWNPSAIMIRKKVFDNIPISMDLNADLKWKFDTLKRGYHAHNIQEYLVEVGRRSAGMSHTRRKELAFATYPLWLKNAVHFPSIWTLYRLGIGAGNMIMPVGFTAWLSEKYARLHQ